VADSQSRIFDPRRILVELADRGVDFVVVGGVAVQAHGHGRATRDLDVIPKPDLLNLSRLGEALAGLSARLVEETRPVDVTDPQLIGRGPLVPLLTRYGRLDLLNLEATPGAPRAYDDLRARAVEADIDGRTIAVAGLDDLVRMKRSAGRDVDIEDIGALTRGDDDLRSELGQST
jgi:hypothetical protein